MTAPDGSPAGEMEMEVKTSGFRSRDFSDGSGSQPGPKHLECKLEYPPTRGDGSSPPHIPLSFSPQTAGRSP